MSELPDWLKPLVDAMSRGGGEHRRAPQRPRSGATGEADEGGTAEPSRSADHLRTASRPPEGGRHSAVLILFGEGPEGPDVLLIQRADSLRQHAGQPAFPGGATDPGDDGPVGTALRESAEEVGLDPAGVRVVALLPEIYLPPTGFRVTPVLGWWHTPAPVGVVDPGEVARVERVPVAELVDPANRCLIRGPRGYAGPAFLVRGLTVWGFTAAVLDRVLELAGWTRPWDTSDVRELPRELADLARRGVPEDPGVPPDPARPAGSGRPVEGDDGPAAEDVLPADDHSTAAPGTVER